MSRYQYFENRVDCKTCKYYKVEGISERCKLGGNMRENWMGTIYLKTPSNRNYDGRCPDYEEAVN
jgi:hypothetical protein